MTRLFVSAALFVSFVLPVMASAEVKSTDGPPAPKAPTSLRLDGCAEGIEDVMLAPRALEVHVGPRELHGTFVGSPLGI